MACKKNCKKDEAQTQNTQPAEPVALNEQEAEQVSGGENLPDLPINPMLAH